MEILTPSEKCKYANKPIPSFCSSAPLCHSRIKTTTRLKIVFNGVVKTTTCVSLNENLIVEPKNQETIWNYF